MCFSGQCPFELWSGECGRRKSDGPCPESFETPEEYEQFMSEQEDLRADYLYEQYKDSLLGI